MTLCAQGWTITLCIGLLALVAGGGTANGSASPPANGDAGVESIENGRLRVGVDLSRGGTISLLARLPDGENLINTADLGRQVQQSYYAGPQPFGEAHPNWKNWAWNPIGTGDVYGHPSRVLQHTRTGASLYVKSIPMQWALNNVPGECEFETWIRLEGDAVRVRCRLTNHRPDPEQYPAMEQELPALYTIGKLYRLFTYDGAAPFTGGDLTQVKNAGPPWAYWRGGESWAALLNDAGWGVGMVHPGVTRFIGGFAGSPNVGGSRDGSTGYIAPLRREILDSNITYTYEYTLVVGTLKRIREWAVAHRVKDPRPNYTFTRDRGHWTYTDAKDTGFPPKGALEVFATGPQPQLIGPDARWTAEEAPRLRVTVAIERPWTRLRLYWKTASADAFSDERRMEVPVKADGQFHAVTFALAGAPGYAGWITGIRLGPALESAETEKAEPGEGQGGTAPGQRPAIRLKMVSWK